MNNIPMILKKLSQKYYQLSDEKRSAFWFTLCNYLQRGMAIITVPIFSRLLTTDQYGTFNIYLTWFELFGLITSLKLPYEGLNNGLIRFESDKEGYASSIAGLSVTMTILWAGIYYLFRKTLNPLLGLTPLMIVFLFVQLLFNPPLYIWANRQRFDFQYRAAVVVTLLITILSPAISVYAVINTVYKTEARIIALAGVQGIFGLVLFFILLRKGKKYYSKEYWTFALRFNLPLVFFYFSMTVLNEADRLQISRICGSSATAVYSVAYSAASLTSLAVLAINGSFSPWMYKRLKDDHPEKISGAADKLFLLVGMACIAMILLAPDLVLLLATNEYLEAVLIIPPVGISVFFIFVYNLFAAVEMFYDETRLTSVVSALCAFLNIALNAVFIRRYGFLAAGWTTLFSYILLTVLHYLLYKKASRKKTNSVEIFNTKHILVLSIILVGMCFAILPIYRLSIVRYLILIVLLFYGFMKFRSFTVHNRTEGVVSK